MKAFILSLIFFTFIFPIRAFDTSQQVFKPTVQSLSVSNPRDFMAPPVIRMGSNDMLDINFDLIGNQHEYLKYRLIHCNADWQPSRLLESEYVNGFNDVPVEDFAYSSSTYVHYINYNISLPDPQLPILASGNYLLQVYPENDPDDIWLQVRFSVSENLAPVYGGFTTKTDRGVNSEYQQLFFEIDPDNLGNINPYVDLFIEITQNNSSSSSHTLSHPMRVESNRIIYEHSPALVFEAGNEYRRFETVRADYPGMHVDSVKFINGMWHAWLQTDFSRRDREYAYDNTQHGRFKIDEYNSTEPDLGADYVMVHFSLDPGERQYGRIYLDGNFTSNVISDRYLMKYDWNDGLYHASLPLKQGSYNYQYVVAADDAKNPSPAPVEGNKYETQNEYLVKVFLRRPGARADRLVGVTIL